MSLKDTLFTNQCNFSTLDKEGPAIVLEKRDALNQFTHQVLRESSFMDYCTNGLHLKGKLSAYAGFDPTGDSLHLGNFFSIISLLRLSSIGIKPIFVVGGATGLIGDPSGKSKEREFMALETASNNVSKIEETIKSTVLHISSYLNKRSHELNLPSELMYHLLNLSVSITMKYSSSLDFEIVDNKEFYKDMPAITFVRDIGKHFRMGVLLAKDSVSGRMGTEEGMSFTEFAYQIFQAYDFACLYKQKVVDPLPRQVYVLIVKNCVIQIGGSDQWGNITNGCDYIRKTMKTEAFGMTTPLLVTAAGQKFGKSEGNSIWIDSKKTPSYDLYQYLFNTADKDVISFLKRFTFLPPSKISEIEKEVTSNPEKRLAQQILAQTLVEMLGGTIENDPAKANTIFFQTDIEQLKIKTAEELKAIFQGIKPSLFLSAESPANKLSLVDLIVLLKIKGSKTEIKRYVTNGALLVNGKKISASEAAELNYKERSLWMAERYLILKFGKKEFHLVEYV